MTFDLYKRVEVYAEEFYCFEPKLEDAHLQQHRNAGLTFPFSSRPAYKHPKRCRKILNYLQDPLENADEEDVETNEGDE